MDLNEFSRKVHQNAVEHGWWDEPRSFPEIVALCHSELSEALEEYRKGRPIEYTVCTGCPYEATPGMNCINLDRCKDADYRDKPEGIAVEMADTIIRILDWCGKENIDIEAVLERKHEYNKTRSYRHGGKKL
mgnify:CR=1 FL=1